MSLCRGNTYDDGYGWSNRSVDIARGYTPYRAQANRAQVLLYDANAVQAYPQDRDMYHYGSGYAVDDEGPGLLDYAVGGVDSVYREESVGVEGPRGSIEASRSVSVSKLSSNDLENIVVDTDSGPYLLSTNTEMEEMAINDPETDIEGGVIITSDNKALVLVSRPTVEAYYNGSIPPEIDRKFSEIIAEETVTNTMEGVEPSDGYVDQGGLVGIVQSGPLQDDLSSNSKFDQSAEKESFVLPVYERDADGQLTMLHAGFRISRRRRKLKKGKRSKNPAVKEARQEVRRREKALKLKKKEKARKRRARKQLEKRRKQIQRLKQEEAKAERELQREEQRFSDEEQRFRQATGTGGSPELPPRDEYYYYYSMGKYDSGERVEPKTITFTGKGEVDESSPKESAHLGKRFHKQVWGINDASYDLVESQALGFFGDYYGIPVEEATKGEDGVYRHGDNFEISPYGIKAGIEMVASNIQGFSDDAEEGAEVHEGGWKLTLLRGCNLGGTYAGDSMIKAKPGSVMKWGHWHITNQEQGSAVHPRIVLHFESVKPIHVEDDHPSEEPIHEEYYVDYADPAADDNFVYTGEAIRSMKFIPDKHNAATKGFVKMTTHINFDQD